MNDYTFGNFLYELRTEKGLSQSELGEMMGVSNKAVSKWEMGISKPRPAMLVVLASFFGVTVEELLAGRRNAETEQQEHGEGDAALKLWAGEYRKKKKRGLNAVLTAILLPFVFIVCVGVIVGTKLEDTALGPTVMMLICFAEAIDIALIFVFYGSARRLKRILYATYPEQAEQIKALISTKKENVPMLKWERICTIISASVALGCNVFRIIAYVIVEENARITVDMVGLLIASLALILEGVVLLHYAIRCRRKKR